MIVNPRYFSLFFDKLARCCLGFASLTHSQQIPTTLPAIVFKDAPSSLPRVTFSPLPLPVMPAL